MEWREMNALRVGLLVGVIVVLMCGGSGGAAITVKTMREVRMVNKEGPFLGLVVPNAFEMGPLLQSLSFLPRASLPYLDLGGRRFRFGNMGKEKVIVVMTGLSMLNAGLSTQLLLTLFNVKGVVHFGIAGNADSSLQIGDVTVPRYWAHTGLWNWQRFGDGPNDELAFESNGDYTREIGYLNFSDYSTVAKHEKSAANLLNNVWYQPEEVFPLNGISEVRQHAFWVPADKHYYDISKKLKATVLEKCVNSTTCLPRDPMVVQVQRGCSANTLVDNASYRQLLRSKFNVTPIDMESAAVALVCHQLQTPFITFRALSDLAGGGSSLSNEASVFAALAAQNAVTVVVQFISMLT